MSTPSQKVQPVRAPESFSASSPLKNAHSKQVCNPLTSSEVDLSIQNLISQFVAPSQQSCLAFPTCTNFFKASSQSFSPYIGSKGDVSTPRPLQSTKWIVGSDSSYLPSELDPRIALPGSFSFTAHSQPSIVHSHRLITPAPAAATLQDLGQENASLMRNLLLRNRKVTSMSPMGQDIKEMEFIN